MMPVLMPTMPTSKASPTRQARDRSLQGTYNHTRRGSVMKEQHTATLKELQMCSPASDNQGCCKHTAALRQADIKRARVRGAHRVKT
jgi:hypothetical protein